MCGICGVVALDGAVDSLYLAAMTDALEHRGPDGRGVWVNDSKSCGLGHRRLGIIDLGDTGSQPMRSNCGRLTLTFNGEIYNYLELRQELESKGAKFRGNSDTEVLLNALLEYGPEKSLKKLDGMFAFALWDARDRTILLARDRFGEKPLYWSSQGGRLYFASELKALRVHPDYRSEIDRDAVGGFLQYSYVPGGLCIYKNTSKLSPGAYLRFSALNGSIEIKPYWSHESLLPSLKNEVRSAEEWTDELEGILKATLRKRMRADVPLGAFLSGGIDSSLIAALMQEVSAKPIHTYTIASGYKAYDESEEAARIASHIGSIHTEYTVSENEALSIVPKLPEMYDEPFGDSSQIPTHMVCILARKNVKVILSGDAGDELFGGYNRYLWAPRIWKRIRGVPRALRSVAASLLTVPSPGFWDGTLGSVYTLMGRNAPRLLGGKIHKAANAMHADSLEAVYNRLTTMWPKGTFPYSFGCNPDVRDWINVDAAMGHDGAEKLMYYDRMTYLPNDILQKVDRASMAVGLEVRVPYLSNEVAGFASRLPIEMKVRGDSSKWILRKLLARHVPESLWERPKAGFGVPIDEWLRGPLRDWAEDLLSIGQLEEVGLNAKKVRKLWDSHLSRRNDFHYPLWNILMLQAWTRRWG